MLSSTLLQTAALAALAASLGILGPHALHALTAGAWADAAIFAAPTLLSLLAGCAAAR